MNFFPKNFKKKLTHSFFLSFFLLTKTKKTLPGAKYAVWSPDGGRVALLCKHAVVLAGAFLFFLFLFLFFISSFFSSSEEPENSPSCLSFLEKKNQTPSSAAP